MLTKKCMLHQVWFAAFCAHYIQAPRNWNGHLHDFIVYLGFYQTPQDPCVYVHIIDNYVVLLAVFVDDILLASRSEAVLAIVKADFQSRFTMTDEGLASEFLGVRIFQGTETVTLDQQHYCETIVRDYGKLIGRRNYSEVPMQANPELYAPYDPTPDQAAWIARFPYATIVGKIGYLTAITRPDIAYAAVSMLSRFLSQPTYRACMAVTRLLHYLSRTASYGLIYHRDELDMHAYSDSDRATCAVTRRSILVQWSSCVVPQCLGCPSVNRSLPHPLWRLSTSPPTMQHRTLSGSEPCLVTSISKIPINPPPYSSTMNLLAPWPTTQFTMLGPSTSMSSSTGSVNRF
jgi:hypothetical protein